MLGYVLAFIITRSFLTSTASQGQTLRKGVLVDCERQLIGDRGMDDDNWWLHLYVMFSRVTQMSDLLLLRPPPRSLLEGGPPASIREQLKQFDQRRQICKARALEIAEQLGFPIPSS